MPIRLENMVTANLEDNSNQPDLKDNIEWLSHGLKETLKLHCGQTRAEFGHNVMSTIMATTTNSIITKDDVSPSNNNNNNISHYSSRCFNNNSMGLGMDSIVQNPTKSLHCSPSNNKRTPVINFAKERHVSKMRSASPPNHLQKWVHQNNRVNKRSHMRRRRKSHINNNIYIEDVRLGIRGKNTDYYHHQKFLSAQTLIQEAVKRLCAFHNNNNSNNNNNIINPNNNNNNNNTTSITTTTPGGVDLTNNGSIINNNNNISNGIGHQQQHSVTTFCNFNISTGNSRHMGFAGVV